jgi:hypothetical protein
MLLVHGLGTYYNLFLIIHRKIVKKNKPPNYNQKNDKEFDY